MSDNGLDRKVAGVSIRDVILIGAAIFFFTGVQDAKGDLANVKAGFATLATGLDAAQARLDAVEAQVTQIDENQAKIALLNEDIDQLRADLKSLDSVKDDILDAVGDVIRRARREFGLAPEQALGDAAATFDLLYSAGMLEATEPELTPTRVQRCFGRRVTIYGTRRANTLTGTNGRDVIAARGGDDVVFAGLGHDYICGGGGADVLYGDGGADRANGGRSMDFCDAEFVKRCETLAAR